MAKSLPPLTWFRAFEAAGRHLSFTAAAEEIGLTQSAVSQHVKSLEQRLGAVLFRRHARGLSLTDAGRRLLPQVEAALDKLTAATSDFGVRLDDTHLTVAASVSVSQWIIAPRLSAFKARHPKTVIRFLSAVWPDEFLTARADVEIRFGSEKQVGAQARRLEPSGLIALKAAGLDGDIDDLPLIESVGTSSGWAAWATAHGSVLTPDIYVDSFGMALHLATQGSGVALVTELLASSALQTGALHRIGQSTLTSQEGYFLSVTNDRPIAQDFAAWILESTQATSRL